MNGHKIWAKSGAVVSLLESKVCPVCVFRRRISIIFKEERKGHRSVVVPVLLYYIYVFFAIILSSHGKNHRQRRSNPCKILRKRWTMEFERLWFIRLLLLCKQTLFLFKAKLECVVYSLPSLEVSPCHEFKKLFHSHASQRTHGCKQ